MPQDQVIPRAAFDALPKVPSTAARAAGPMPDLGGMSGDDGSDPGFISQIPRHLKDVGIGVAKGAGNTAFGLGEMVHSIPGVGSVTDELAKIFGEKVLGQTDVNPDLAFSERPSALDATNTSQSIGKGIEQVGEFLIPAGVARKAAIEGLVRLIPDAASPGAMKVLNQAGAIIGRVAGEMGSAASVGTVHGDENDDTEALLAGAGPLVGSGLAKAAQNPLARKIAANAGGGLAASLVPFKSFGLSMGTFGSVRAALERLLSSKGAQQAIPKATSIVGRLAAGARSEMNDQ